jgi:hypothetical protein
VGDELGDGDVLRCPHADRSLKDGFIQAGRLTVITVVIAVVMTVRWRSRTPLVLLAIGTAARC